MMNCHHHHHVCQSSCDFSCPYPQWIQPLLCNQTHYCWAENTNGPTLVIHKIVLDSCGNQSCTPRNFTILITGPSYPAGETFTLRAGSCTELDEPLVISGLIPGTYRIEEIHAAAYHCGHGNNCSCNNCGCNNCGCSSGCECNNNCCYNVCGWYHENEYDTTFTGPICGNTVNVIDSTSPTVITIVSRRRLRGCRRRRGCHRTNC